MEQNTLRHTYVVCAYKESPYLEKCIESLRKQTVESRIIVATSTPNTLISGICEKYDLPLRVNENHTGIAGDWNFAMEQADTELVTIAHQDDIYYPTYTESVLSVRTEKALIIFTDYAEIRNGKTVLANVNLRIKRILLLPLRVSLLQRSPFIRRRSLSLGNPICCPSVTYVRENLPQPFFKEHFRSNVDWDAWERISKNKGRFVYIPKVLIGHRIHSGSETSATIEGSVRSGEDMEIFGRFWPPFVAGFINRFYVKSEKSNVL